MSTQDANAFAVNQGLVEIEAQLRKRTQAPRREIAKYRPSAWQRFATWALEWAERFFLHAHGWYPETPVVGANQRSRAWLPPDGYAFKRHPDYVRSHAVNAQKQAVYNPQHGGTRRDPDLARSMRA